MLKLLLSSAFVLLISSTSVIAREAEDQLADKNKVIESLAEDVEGVLITSMLKTVFESIEVDPVFGGGNAEKIYRELLVEEYAKDLASGKGFGLKAAIIKDIQKTDTEYQNLIRTQK